MEDNGGVYFVPAFSGLYAPYWKHNARGVIAGLTRYTNKGHLARAVLEATAFQTREVVEAMEKDAGVPLGVLRTDGGMVENDLLMQFQADILDRDVVRPGGEGDHGAGRGLRRRPGRGLLRRAWTICARNGRWTTPGDRNMDARAARDDVRTSGKRQSRDRSTGWRRNRHMEKQFFGEFMGTAGPDPAWATAWWPMCCCANPKAKAPAGW